MNHFFFECCASSTVQLHDEIEADAVLIHFGFQNVVYANIVFLHDGIRSSFEIGFILPFMRGTICRQYYFEYWPQVGMKLFR